MNLTNSKIGIASAIIIFMGCVFKAFHLQGAAALFLGGNLLFSFVFIPVTIYTLLRKGELFNSIACFFFNTMMLGVIFKVMQWPYANFLITWSVTIALFLLTPIYLFRLYKRNLTEKYNHEARVKDIFIGVFILACLSMWYLMIDLNQIPSPYSQP
jgi:uncharacterized membrane protein